MVKIIEVKKRECDCCGSTIVERKDVSFFINVDKEPATFLQKGDYDICTSCCIDILQAKFADDTIDINTYIDDKIWALKKKNENTFTADFVSFVNYDNHTLAVLKDYTNPKDYTNLGLGKYSGVSDA